MKPLACIARSSASPLTSHRSHAQIAGAIGKPLPSPDLPAGTISVRVVAGRSR